MSSNEEYEIRQARKAAGHFLPDRDVADIHSFGNGHIGDTYLLTLEDGEKLVLQRIALKIFNNPENLMENVLMVTEHLQKKISEMGGDPRVETLNFLRTENGEPFYRDEEGSYYRMYFYIDGLAVDQPRDARDFYESGIGFGNFQYLLSDFDAGRLHEVKPIIHDPEARFSIFCSAVNGDKMGRAGEVQNEIRFVMDHEDLAYKTSNTDLPVRVIHNDAKLNNVILDEKTGRAICIIDLDTVMPGLVGYDFGDSIRFGACTAEEDERDLSKVTCSMELFEIYTRGFLEGCRNKLTKNEIRTLPMFAEVITFECGMRFLTDYLEGDVYFKTSREGHNLDRCRAQFKLLSDMEAKRGEMNRIIGKYI